MRSARLCDHPFLLAEFRSDMSERRSFFHHTKIAPRKSFLFESLSADYDVLRKKIKLTIDEREDRLHVKESIVWYLSGRIGADMKEWSQLNHIRPRPARELLERSTA